MAGGLPLQVEQDIVHGVPLTRFHEHVSLLSSVCCPLSVCLPSPVCCTFSVVCCPCVSCILSVLCCLLSVRCLLSAIRCLLFAVRCPLSAVWFQCAAGYSIYPWTCVSTYLYNQSMYFFLPDGYDMSYHWKSVLESLLKYKSRIFTHWLLLCLWSTFYLPLFIMFSTAASEAITQQKYCHITANINKTTLISFHAQYIVISQCVHTYGEPHEEGLGLLHR